MGLATMVRSAVATANRLTGGTDGLQVSVTHQPAGTPDTYGAHTPGTAVSRTALYEAKARTFQGPDGRERIALGVVTFLDGGAAIGEFDVLTLADGSVPPILAVEGLRDDTGLFVTQVWLGASPSRGMQ
jgi:hypothetical protein